MESSEAGATFLKEAERRSRFVRRTIASESVPEVDTAEALERIGRRLTARRLPGRDAAGSARARGGPRLLPTRLAWAAAVTLILGGAAAAAAVPGSPVRAWLERALGGDPTQVEAGPRSGQPAPAAPSAAARVVPGADRFVVSVTALPATGEIHVRVVPDRRLSIDAPAGSRFTSGAERIDVRPAAGIVRVDLPRDLPHAVLTVDDQIVLERRGETVSIPGGRVERRGETWIVRGSGP